MAVLSRTLAICATVWLALPGLLHAQTLQNSASAELNTLSLDLSQATVTLTRRTLVDVVNSTVTVDPPVVYNDGIALSTITVTVRDANNQPLAGRLVSLASSRGALDTLTQPLAPTDANGVTTGEIRSTTAGIAGVLATDVVESALLNDQPEVLFTQGEVLTLVKTVNPDRATVGDIVTYSITIQNTTDRTITDVRIVDDAAPVLAFLPGTARLDGTAIPDPTRGAAAIFAIGEVPPLVDTNGNGVADPDESGYRILTYAMVVGAGARKGSYANVAVAIDLCDSCVISQEVGADLEIAADRIFDLSTVIGKVFHDRDGDGWQDRGEPGIGGAMVALDNGLYARTDKHGRYHFPAIDPGQRMVKLNLASIAGDARATGRVRQVLTVTPGLLAKANFGVHYAQETESIGRDGEYGYAMKSATATLPDQLTGSASDLGLVVNGVRVGFANADVSLANADANAIVNLGENGSIEPLHFDVSGPLVGQATGAWTLRVWRGDDDKVKSLSGSGALPARITWANLDEIRERLLPGRIYLYQLEAKSANVRTTSARQMFGVNRETEVALELRGGAFRVDSNVLTPRAQRLLGEATKIMHEHPDEIIRIYGHTDSSGSRAHNQLLSEQRARAAFDYLVDEGELPPDRLVVKGFGEDRPVASNATASGRELNRRVEIFGELTKVERARLYETRTNALRASMNGLAVQLDDAGVFRKSLRDTELTGIDVSMMDELGASVRVMVGLPSLSFSEPAGVLLRAYAADDPRRTTAGDGIQGAEYAYDLAGRTDPGNRLEIDDVAIATGEDGTFRIPLRLKSGNNMHVISAQNDQGMVRYANLRFEVSTSIDGKPVLAVAPVPNLALQLPPRGIPMRNANLVVPGYTDPGNTVHVNGEPVEVDSDGRFNASVQLVPGGNRITAAVTDPLGYTGGISRDINYSTDSLFIMALAETKISQIRREGNLRAAGADSASESLAEGRIALYMKGTILGKYLITAAFDTGQSELGELFSDLDAIENERLITNLDPDTIYPVYGDDSTVVWDTDSKGKLYLALSGQQIDAVVGNYPLSLTDTELTTYQRTLYGARVKYSSQRKTADGRSATDAEVFVATVDQVPVRDEIAATGGSLYFMSHTDVVEGSEQVSLLVRDQITGLLLQRIQQRRNVDYEVKYREGRIWFRRPVSSVIDDGSIIGTNMLSGNPITIQIDYESREDGLGAGVSGLRLNQRFADGRLRVGGTMIEDDRVSSKYNLYGVDAEIRLGNTRVVAEFAESTGSDSLVFQSSDGGLQFAPLATGPAQNGNAFKLAAEFDAGAWLGQPERLVGSAYYRNLTAGFASNGNFSVAGDQQIGAALAYKSDDRNTFLLRIDDRQTGQTDSSTQTSFLWRHQRDRLAFEGEYQDRRLSDPNRSGAIAALRAIYQWSEQLSASLEHQQAFDGSVDSRSAAAIDYALRDDLHLSGRAVLGPDGEAFQGGASWETSLGRFYAQQRLPGGSGAPGAKQQTLIGAEAPFGAGGTLYTEYQWDRSGPQRGLRSIAGLRRDWSITDGLTLLVSGEQTTLQSGAGGNKQNALIGGLSYDLHGIKFTSRNEWRKQSGTTDLSQIASFNRGEVRLASGFTLLGEYRLSNSDDPLRPDQSTETAEASLGFALRPVEHDRWNLLFKLTRLDNNATPAQIDSRYDNSRADLLATEWSLQINSRIEWVGKQAFKKKLTKLEPGQNYETNTSLSIQRLNFRIPWDLWFGAEYRLLRQKEAADSRSGFLGELMWNGFENVGIGVGYNLTEFSSDLRYDSGYSEYGWFLRLQGKY